MGLAQMITSTRIGRYGNTCNSMFQFAAVVGMAKKTGLEYCIPRHESYYDVNYECDNHSIFSGFDIDVPELMVGLLTFKEVNFPFEYSDKEVDDFTDMVGYFQSEKYFENAKQEVRNQFKFKSSVTEVVDDKIANGYYPDPLYCTSIHMRLGDYQKKRDYHPAMTSDYYQTASKLTCLKNYVIFSDDIATAKQMLGESSNVYYADDENPFSALYHMSLCSNHIICNSTFGWWGAWLGEQSRWQKTIIAPKTWFGPKHNYDSSDIIPERWNLL